MYLGPWITSMGCLNWYCMSKAGVNMAMCEVILIVFE